LTKIEPLLAVLSLKQLAQRNRERILKAVREKKNDSQKYKKNSRFLNRKLKIKKGME
jgi:hypothetical protein